MEDIRSLIHRCLQTLAVEIGPRPAASKGQDRAREFIVRVLTEAGWDVEVQRTECPRWELGALSLRLDGNELDALANPHAPACHVSAPVVRVETLEHLKQSALAGHVAVLSGELTTAPFFPRNFDFYRDERQDDIISTVEQKAPLAVIMVSGQEHAAALIADSGFALPSVTVAAPVGAQLKDGQMVEVRIEASSQPAFASSVVARRPGAIGKRLVVCAHYDTAFYTPGAVDNAGGAATLLALARYLQSDNSGAGVELVAFGGEDSWYPSEVDYPRRNAAYFADITAAINIDGIGIKGNGDTVAFLECPEALTETVMGLLPRHPGIERTDPWYSGDHSLFWPQGIPSLALTSAGGFGYELLHTSADTVEQVDAARIERTVEFIRDIVRVMR